MEKEFETNPGNFYTWTLEEYIDFFIDFLELLRPDLLIERFAGEVPPRFVNTTPWGLVRNVEMIRMLEKRLEQRDTFQSRLYQP
jgi:radical SAM superfamily enzyme